MKYRCLESLAFQQALALERRALASTRDATLTHRKHVKMAPSSRKRKFTLAIARATLAEADGTSPKLCGQAKRRAAVRRLAVTIEPLTRSMSGTYNLGR